MSMKRKSKNKDVAGEMLLFFFFVFMVCHFKPFAASVTADRETGKEIKVISSGTWVLSAGERSYFKNLSHCSVLLPNCRESRSSLADLSAESHERAPIIYSRVKALLQNKYHKQQKVPEEPSGVV
jgi:hypothetical protein